MSDAEELLVDIGDAVSGMNDRLAAVEAAVVGAQGDYEQPSMPRRRRPFRSRSAGSAALRRAQQRRRDAGGITWTVWNLDALTVAQRKAAFVELQGFVDWINRGYQLPLSTLAITPCWYHHSGVVRELWALLASYEHAYSTRLTKDVTLPSDLPLLWHERSLWPCLRRLRAELGLQECVASKRHTLQIQNAISTDDGFVGAVTNLAAEWTSLDGPHEFAHGEDVP